MKNRKIRNAALAALVAPIVVLAGCATEGEMLRDEGYPVAYTEGYDDGCSSGKHAAGSMFDKFRKDVHRYQDDADYRDGWHDGERECEKQWQATQHDIERAQDQYERDRYYSE